MKTTLHFDCEDPDDREALDICLEAGSVKSALHDFEMQLRAIYKYEEHSDEIHNMVERIRSLFYDSLGEYL